jgi:hypothetical protein
MTISLGKPQRSGKSPDIMQGNVQEHAAIKLSCEPVKYLKATLYSMQPFQG